MKNLLLIVLILGIAISGFTQNRATVSKELRDYSVRKARHVKPPSEFSKSPTIPAYKADFTPVEEIIGKSIDVPERLAKFEGLEKKSVVISNDYKDLKDYLILRYLN